MELYIGGIGQGKLQYVLQKRGFMQPIIADGAVCTSEDLSEADIINHFHLYLRSMLKQQADVVVLLEQVLYKCQDTFIIMDEVGCGIVPMDAFERQYRELAGRIGCTLAQHASHVERITCGIGCVLK